MRQASQTEARKKDTREKIQLGGLIAKAGPALREAGAAARPADRRRRASGRRSRARAADGDRREGVHQ
jgi:hypothetical protein